MSDSTNVKLIGLALSGGGFRGTLFHLGVVRFLRDAGILPSVSHITSVSGGSILAAHLVQNWDRYTGTTDQFEAAAADILRFTQLDVRNRIVRRVPLAAPVHLLRWMLRLGRRRRLTRTGMLEGHYQDHLYGDTCMFQLPATPYLHVLSTNLTEGALCSFTRDGLIIQKRTPGELYRFDRMQSGLTTMALAVTASSAFPGFFPPLQVEGHEVGATEGQFNRQVFTDGGVFDNLGVRMFRNIERSWIGRDVSLSRRDFYELKCVTQALTDPGDAPTPPLARLVELYGQTAAPAGGDDGDAVLVRLRELIKRASLYRDPAFDTVAPDDPEAAAQLKAVRAAGKEPEMHDRIWLNRQLLEAVLRQSTGKRCMRPLGAMFDVVLVSDAGKHLRALSEVHDMGMITTAMRASDIGMDRVWQLENETFSNQPGFLFVPITRVVDQSEDPTALHPEVQRRLQEIRTDMDRFSDLEVSTLVRHGYCVARSICQSRRELFGDDLPTTPPWDPIDLSASTSKQHRRVSLFGKPQGPAPDVVMARSLQQSAARRILSRMFSPRDWVSYVYLLILVPLLALVPWRSYYFYQAREKAGEVREAIESVARGNEDEQIIMDLVRYGPVAPWPPVNHEGVAALQPTTHTGVEFVSDTQIFDARTWLDKRSNQGADVATADSPSATVPTYLRRRIRFHKTGDFAEHSPFYLKFRLPDVNAQARSLNASLSPIVHRRAPAAGEVGSEWQIELNLSSIPVGEPIDVQLEATYRDQTRANLESRPHVDVDADLTVPLLNVWVLLPENKPYQGYRLVEFAASNSSQVSVVHPSAGRESSYGTVIQWALLSPDAGARYECLWAWKR